MSAWTGRRPSPVVPAHIAASCLALALGACRPGLPASPGPPPQPSLTLAPGSTVKRALGGAAGHVWRLELEPGKYTRVDVEPSGVDVALKLCDASGRELLRLDRAVGDFGAESLAFVADAGGTYVFEVSAREPKPDASYTLHIGVSHRPDPGERLAAEAFALESRADLEHRAARPGALGRACTLCDQALERWRRLPAAAETALALRHCARLRTLHGELNTALGLLEAALALHGQARNPRAVAQARAELADLEARLWRFERASRDAELALAEAREVSDHWAEALALHVHGDHAAQVGDPLRALGYYRRALRLWNELGDHSGEAQTLTALGNAETLLGDTDAARQHFLLARGLRRAAGDVGGEAEDLAYLGWLAYLDKHHDAAKRYYEQAIPPLEALERNADLGGVLDRQGSTWLQLGQYHLALSNYRRALPLIEASGEAPGVARILSNIGAAHRARGEWEPARRAYAEARRRLDQAQDLDVEALGGVLLGSAKLNRAAGRLAPALDDIEDAIALLERLRAQVGVQISRAMYLSVRHRFFELHVALLMDLHAAQPGAAHDVRAFEAAERARARTLLDDLMWAHTAPGRRVAADPRELERRIEEAEARLRDISTRGASKVDQQSVERELVDLLAERNGSRAHPEDIAATPSIRLGDVQRDLLDADTLLLAYALGERKSFLWVVGQQRFETYELPPRDAIEASARATYAGLQISQQRASRARTLHAAARLSDIVLGPVSGRLTRRLVIAADGALQYIPFAALPVRPSQPARVAGFEDWPDGRAPLLAEHEVLSAPSAAVLLALRRTRARRVAPQHDVAVVTDPVYSIDDTRLAAVARSARVHEGTAIPRELRLARAAAGDTGQPAFERLVYSAPEAEFIRSLVPPAEFFEARGFDATRALVLSGRLRDYRILHFATHGVLNERMPELSGLLLSMRDRQGRPLDGLLRVRDLAQLELLADLVVLGACDTALGRELRGEGLFGLTQGFLKAGARRVVVSLWSVDDLATAALMQRFYRYHLCDGLAPAAALRAAQLELAAQPGLSAPAYWGGFILQGDWHE